MAVARKAASDDEWIVGEVMWSKKVLRALR